MGEFWTHEGKVLGKCCCFAPAGSPGGHYIFCVILLKICVPALLFYQLP